MHRVRYGSFPTTADVGIWARAPTGPALFGALGQALYAQIADLRGIRLRDERTVRAQASDLPALVVDYLSKLLLLQQEDGFIGRRIEVSLPPVPSGLLTARVRGERFDPARHAPGIEVKAVTFHRLEVDLQRGFARVILDI